MPVAAVALAAAVVPAAADRLLCTHSTLQVLRYQMPTPTPAQPVQVAQVPMARPAQPVRQAQPEPMAALVFVAIRRAEQAVPVVPVVPVDADKMAHQVLVQISLP